MCSWVALHCCPDDVSRVWPGNSPFAQTPRSAVSDPTLVAAPSLAIEHSITLISATFLLLEKYWLGYYWFMMFVERQVVQYTVCKTYIHAKHDILYTVFLLRVSGRPIRHKANTGTSNHSHIQTFQSSPNLQVFINPSNIYIYTVSPGLKNSI